MKYRICPYCGAHLDFGEACDCQSKRITAPSAGTPGTAKGGDRESSILSLTEDKEDCKR